MSDLDGQYIDVSPVLRALQDQSGRLMYQANLAEKNDNWLLALKFYEQICLRPAIVEYRTGRAYLKCLGYDQAIECFKKALEFDPKNTPAVFQLTQIYLKLGDEKGFQKFAAILFQHHFKQIGRLIELCFGFLKQKFVTELVKFRLRIFFPKYFLTEFCD